MCRLRMERENIDDQTHPAYGLMPPAGAEPPVGGGHAFHGEDGPRRRLAGTP